MESRHRRNTTKIERQTFFIFHANPERLMSTRAAACLFLVLLLACLLHTAHPASINIPAHGKECFFEELNKGDRMTITFQVGEGGNLDVDFWVCSVRTTWSLPHWMGNATFVMFMCPMRPPFTRAALWPRWPHHQIRRSRVHGHSHCCGRT